MQQLRRSLEEKLAAGGSQQAAQSQRSSSLAQTEPSLRNSQAVHEHMSDNVQRAAGLQKQETQVQLRHHAQPCNCYVNPNRKN